MVNYLGILENPQIKHERIFEVMRDFRRGGISPDNYPKLIELIHQLPPINHRTFNDYQHLVNLGLVDVNQQEFTAVRREVLRRAIESSKCCWHPEANMQNCHRDSNGKVIISAAHSIQNNGILSQIAEDGHVMSYSLPTPDMEGESIGKNKASTFYGMCNHHDGIFRPIETEPYTGTDEQNFLFAYRGLLHAYHKKYEVSQWMNFGPEWRYDFDRNRTIFNDAILNRRYNVIRTHSIELPAFYPIATTAGFYLDFDFLGTPLMHSDHRMELIYISLVPYGNRTFFLLSFLDQDAKLYGRLGNQLVQRNNLKSDITMLIAAHVENVYFNPTYYRTFIERHEASLLHLMQETQLDYGKITVENEVEAIASFTPPNYLLNNYQINFFGY